MIKLIALATALTFFTLTGAAQATGLMTCKSGDRSTWKSQQELTRKISADGWKVRHVKVDGGCYEVYGTSPKGQRVEAYFHPVSLELLLIARRGEILFRKK
jgi:hypothetical protein